ncbi:MAG: hypothetical protein LBI60_03595, partial [Bacteroidales bacterium]|nr:hypothetical protein [Bacteroidales bacterium]
MRKILLTSVLILLTGYGMAQTATIGGDFLQGLRCVSPTQSAMFELRNNSSNPAGITGVKWEVKDNASGNIIYTSDTSSTFFQYPILFSQAGTFTATMIVQWGSVERTASMNIVIHSVPQFSFTKDNDSICPGGAITFNYSMTSPFTQGMVKSVSWDFGTGATSSALSPTYRYMNNQNAETSYPVSLTITDTNQCANRIEYLDFIFVRTKPKTEFTADNTFFCFGGSTATEAKPVFTNKTDEGNPAANNTYKWLFGDGATSTSEHPTHTYAPANLNYPVTLIATDQHGCVDTLIKNNYITLQQLIPQFTLSDTVLCSLPASITASGPPIVRYEWEVDNIVNGKQDGTNVEFKFRTIDAGPHTLTLTIRDRDHNSCFVDTIIPLHIFDKVVPTITAADTNDCDPDHTISFTNSTSYPWSDDFGKAQTSWDFRDGTNGAGHTVTHTYGTSATPVGELPDGGYGNYRVMMTGTTPYGCPLDTVYQTIHIYRMYAVAEVIDPAPPASPHGCIPHSVTLANNEDSLVSSSDISSFVWKWNFDPNGQNPKADNNDTTLGSITGEETHIYTDTGSYNVYLTLTNEQGCVHNIFVKYIMAGDTPLVDFTFIVDTNCKALINIQVAAHDSAIPVGSENWKGNALANGWSWQDKDGNPIGGSSDTSSISPNEIGEAYVKLVASHNGCNAVYVPEKEGGDLGYVCPPIAVIKEPKDDPPGQPPVFCGFDTIPFISESKGALYQRWYAGDYFDTTNQGKNQGIKDTAFHSKS